MESSPHNCKCGVAFSWISTFNLSWLLQQVTITPMTFFFFFLPELLGIMWVCQQCVHTICLL